MPGIEELVGGDPRPHQTTFNSVETATIRAVLGSEVSLTVDSFARDQAYAVVPFVPASATPSAGQSAVLHSDSDGNPIYAVVFS